MASTSTLLVHFGDFPSLAAACAGERPEAVLSWHPVAPRQPGAGGRRRAAQRTAEIFGMRGQLSDGAAMPTGPGPVSGAITELALLARAVAVAAAHGCDTVWLPLQRGQVARDVLESVERVETYLDALMVGAGAADAPRIELPVVDLDDDQIVDLIAAAGRSFDGGWACETDQAEPCGACRGCRRWSRAMHRAGVRCPWAGPAAEPAPASGLVATAGQSPAAGPAGGRAAPVIVETVDGREAGGPARPGRSIAGFIRSGEPVAQDPS